MAAECHDIAAFYSAIGGACSNPRAAECPRAISHALATYGKPCLGLPLVQGDPSMPPFRAYVCTGATGELATLCDHAPSNKTETETDTETQGTVTLTGGQALASYGGAVLSSGALGLWVGATGNNRMTTRQQEALQVAACINNPMLCTTLDDIVTELQDSTEREDDVRLEASDEALASALHDVVDKHASLLREEDGSLSVKSLKEDKDLEMTMLDEIRTVAAREGSKSRADAVQAAVNRVLQKNSNDAYHQRDIHALNPA